MEIQSKETEALHKEIVDGYKERLGKIEEAKDSEEEQEEPFERSLLHNAIYLHRLWFEQIESSAKDTSSPLLEEILKRRESDLSTFKSWISEFAKASQPNGWAIWGWAHSLKTFVGFPIRGHDDSIPLGVTPLLVIDCWEHSYLFDFKGDFDTYVDAFWQKLDWDVIEKRHHELATLFGYNLK